CAHRGEERPLPAPADLAVEPQVGDRARDERRCRGRERQGAPLAAELARRLEPARPRGEARIDRHLSRLDVIRRYGFVYGDPARSDRRSLGEVEGFTDAQVERARRYHRPLYLALLGDAALALGLLAALAYTPFGDGLYEPVE